jgi:hypothetical protein
MFGGFKQGDAPMFEFSTVLGRVTGRGERKVVGVLPCLTLSHRLLELAVDADTVNSPLSDHPYNRRFPWPK